jgi:hypothetical protein
MRIQTIVCTKALVLAGLAAVPAAAQGTAQDPRTGLRAGWMDAGQAARNVELVSHTPRPAGFFNAQDLNDYSRWNADFAFAGNTMFLGGFHGIQIYDVTDRRAPRLRGTLVCPGGQGDVSVYGNLLFMSVEETRGRVDCGGQGVEGASSAERFRGVRIFDVSNAERPRQVAAVQTCRGSHTHTLVPNPRDSSVVHVYVSGTAPVRPGTELAGCTDGPPEQNPNTSLFQIEVIRVPVARPQEARVVAAPRIFADSAGNVAGLWRGGAHGQGTQETAETNMCHDITVYPEMGLAAGACSGNGILLDIRDPAAPRRIAAVSDPNFAYWHSANFSNDASKVLFTDEWGGGTQARCRASDRPTWGANAIFAISQDRRMDLKGYYKLPAAQGETENCVAHNGSLIPVPGRDIMAQAWYQGGMSIFDFTDPAKPVEIAYFDRGPMDAARMAVAGYWSTYWYNGHIYASEMGRGLDIFTLKPSEHLSQNEIDAANLVRDASLNPQVQTKIVWPAHPSVAKAYMDQMVRGNAMTAAQAAQLGRDLDRAAARTGNARGTALNALAARVQRGAGASRDAARMRMVADVIRDMAR